MNHDEYRAKYTSALEYPTKEQFTKVFVYSKGEVVWRGLYADFKPFSEGRFKGMLVEKVVDEDAFKVARRVYAADQVRLTEQFRQDLFVEHDVVTNPKRDKCYSLAWDQGHSAGYGAVASYFDTFVDLIKD